MTAHLIIVSGRSGSGKSSVANEMSQQLRLRGIPHANIDGDNLDALYPEPEGSDVLLANLEAMWTTYTCTIPSMSRLIVSGTAIVLDFEAIKQIMAKIGGSRDHGVEGKAVILTAGHGVAASRLRAREVGSEFELCLASSNKMADILEEMVGDWADRVATDEENVRDTALHILRQAGWIH